MFQTNGGLLMHSEADPSPWLVPSDAVTCEAHEAAQHWCKLLLMICSAYIQMIINVGSVAGIEPYVGGGCHRLVYRIPADIRLHLLRDKVRRELD